MADPGLWLLLIRGHNPFVNGDFTHFLCIFSSHKCVSEGYCLRNLNIIYSPFELCIKILKS